MAKKFFTDDSLSTLVSEIKTYTDSSSAERATKGHGIYYGTCATEAATAEKVVTLTDSTGFSLTTGAVVVVKFTYANSVASPTLNVNSTGAKSIMRYGTTAASTSTTTSGWVAGAISIFIYDGTNWVRDYWYNTTYSNVALGQGYVTCSTAAATTAKVGTLSSYALVTGGIVAVKFTYAVPASATLNINSKGAKAIYFRGAAIKVDVIKAGDIATFIYNGSQYHLLTIDRWQNDITSLQTSVDSIGSEVDDCITGLSVSGTTITYTKNDGSTGTISTQDTNTDTKVTNTLATTTKAYVTGTTSSSTNTGTQVFDTGVYLDTTAGMLTATTFKGALSGNATTATSATSATSATKATQDASGNVITSTYETKTDASAKLTEAKTYADSAATAVKNDLLNGAGTAYDTLKELGDLIDTNVDAIEALEAVAAGKADSDHTHSAATTSAAGFMSASDKSKLDGITASADSVSFSRSLTSGTKVGTITINGTGTDLYAPTNTDTHYTSKNVVGATTATSNTTSALTNGNVYLNSVENSAVTSSHKISGSGATTVTTDTSGNIVITSTNTTYSSAGSSLGLVKSGGDVTISSGVITVNDDSHNHTIANIDDLQTTIDEINSDIEGKADAEHTHTVSHTPAGTVSQPTFTGTAVTSGSPSATATVASSTHTHKYTPSGTVSTPTFTGSAVTSGTPSATTSVYSITGVGSVPSLTASVSDRCLTLTFSAGSVPTRSSVTVASSGHTHSVTASGTVSQPTFTGTEASTTSISGTTSVAGSGHTHSVTASGTVSKPTFTGTAATLTTSTES